MRSLLLLLLLTISLYGSSYQYNEPKDTFIYTGVGFGLASKDHSEQLFFSVGVEQRIPDSILFGVVEFGSAEKTHDTFDQICINENSDPVCQPENVIDNSLQTTYLEYGMSAHLVDTKDLYVSVEAVGHTTLSATQENGVVDDNYFDGVAIGASLGKYFANGAYGVRGSTKMYTSIGWTGSVSIFTKF